MPLTARRHVRKMRGGAQSHLLEADDGHFYIVKFQNNPQHRRILVNELVAATFLKYLQISAARAEFIRITPEFLAANPEIYIHLGTQRIPVAPGWHFGSRHPGDPAVMAVYDFVPDALLGGVSNLTDFLAALVFDKWMANADGRQCIFFRARVEDWQSVVTNAFVAVMIDHGFVFNGPNWDFSESPLQGLYPRKMVYDRVRSLDDFQPWLDQIVHFPEEIVDQALRRIPPEWLEGDEEQFEQLLEKLLRRRARVPDLIRDARQARVNPFPNWR
ncbi:MAG TPA: HipA family kinase [Bryobacteraceae bacterium]|nr:HipA family kinase [Bryobacteraceae bacterium]